MKTHSARYRDMTTRLWPRLCALALTRWNLATLLLRTLLAGLALIALTSCGGGGGDGPPPDGPTPAARVLFFDSVEECSYVGLLTWSCVELNAPYATQADSVHVFGHTSVADPDCLTTNELNNGGWNATQARVEWQNSSNATQDVAVTYPDYYLFGTQCTWLITAMNWSARGIPLAIGPNDITFTATYPDGQKDVQSISVTRLRESIPPAVTATNPADGATGVPVNATLTATFSENLDPASVTSATFQVTYGTGTPIPGSVTYLNGRVQFTPTYALVAGTLHMATLTVGIRDESGNALANNYVWTFTTGSSADLTPPAVLGTDPANGATCFAPDGTLSANFSEVLDTRSVEAGAFGLNGPSGSVAGYITFNGNGSAAYFKPTSALSNDQTYTATLSGQIKDLAGNPLGADYSWSFTTSPTGIGSWQATTSVGAPVSRGGHTAIWTGSEMIVWGGADSGTGLRLADGSRYDPSTNSWKPMSVAPFARTRHIAVWTGSEMIVWSGFGANSTSLPSSGAIYSPVTDSWRTMSSAGAPEGRTNATAIWTGTELIVWGGYAQGPVGGTPGPALGNGARYNPATDTWQPMAVTNGPGARSGYSAVWTGNRLIIWGGNTLSGAATNTGAEYDPATDTWQPLPASGAPTARAGHSATWTGSEMIIWGGAEQNVGPVNSGARYDPIARAWQSTPTDCAVAGQSGHAAVWTGSELLIWGGLGASVGGRLNPTTANWRPISTISQPYTRDVPPPAVWTGTEMIVWTGYGLISGPGAGARYLP